MAYFSMHAYDADVWVQEFRGINQIDTSLNPDPRYATLAEGVETPNGVLQPAAEYAVHDGPLGNNSPRVETLMTFYRRCYAGQGDPTWYVCACGGKLYQKQKGSSVPWGEIPMPNGIASFQSNVWSWVTYEANSANSDWPVDVLIISNAKDGMFVIIPPDRPTTWGDLAAQQETWGSLSTETWGNLSTAAWQIQVVDTRADRTSETEPQKKFGVIERHAERIWGGAMENDPDMLVYSRPYAPTDWTIELTEGQESEGAGDVMQPSWDGDRFFALKRFGDYLLAFKKNHIWRIMGFGPGEYTMQEQFGGGTEFPNTIAVEGERVYMAGRDGILIYDGSQTRPYITDQIAQIWKTINTDAMDQMCGAMFDQRYYLSFPTGDSTVNNAVLVLNLREGTILFYPDTYIEAFLPTDDKLFATSSSLPGKILEVKYDSWETGECTGKPTRWVTPWMDFGYKRIQKGGYEVYFTPEVKGGAPVVFEISIQTEKKVKSKLMVVEPTTFKAKQRRIRFGGAGRRFRLIISTRYGPKSAVWRLLGGVQMIVETDPD